MYASTVRKNFSRNDLTLDHVIPISKGGDTSWENVTTSLKFVITKKGILI